jgi:PKD repeat protein
MGTYTFELLVDDGDGGTSVDSVAVVVTGLPPVARLSANPVEAEVGQAISFDGSGSTDPDGVIVDFAFAFGDETTAAGQEAGPRHAYAEVGTFEVTLTVTDDDGNTDSASLSVTVSEPPTRQIAVDVNWKPLVAGIFAAILLVVGVRASRRSSGGPGGTRRFAGLAFATTSLPFVLAEVATGVLSYFTGLLAIPPIVGLGLAVDVVILGVGVGVAVWKSRQSVTAARRKETGA